MPKREIYKSKLPKSFDEISFTLKDIKEYKSKYIGSKLERHDIKEAYLKYKGCLTHMTTEILFMDHTSEPRIKNIISRMIRNGEVPAFEGYTQEDQTHKKGENHCRELIRYQGNSKNSDRLSRGVCTLLKKYKPYKPKRRIPKKYLHPRRMNTKVKAITLGETPANQSSSFKSPLSFVGGIVKGLFN